MEPHKSIHSEIGLRMLGKVRAFCEGLPETEETIDGFGHTTFRVGGKSFIMLGEGSGRGPGMTIRTLPTTQEVLLQQPYYEKAAYIGQHGWISVRAEAPVPWEEIESHMLEAYCRTAPKRLVKLVAGNDGEK